MLIFISRLHLGFWVFCLNAESVLLIIVSHDQEQTFYLLAFAYYTRLI